MQGATATGGGKGYLPGIGEESTIEFEGHTVRVELSHGTMFPVVAEVERDATYHVGVTEDGCAHVLAVEDGAGRRDVREAPGWLETVLYGLGASEVSV